MINKRPARGYTDKVQEQNLDVLVPGIGTSGEEDLAKRPANDFNTPKEYSENSKSNGDNPNV